jgi:hypothetical protein
MFLHLGRHDGLGPKVQAEALFLRVEGDYLENRPPSANKPSPMAKGGDLLYSPWQAGQSCRARHQTCKNAKMWSDKIRVNEPTEDRPIECLRPLDRFPFPSRPGRLLAFEPPRIELDQQRGLFVCHEATWSTSEKRPRQACSHSVRSWARELTEDVVHYKILYEKTSRKVASFLVDYCHRSTPLRHEANGVLHIFLPRRTGGDYL